MPCLPAGATIEHLDDQAAHRRVADPALSLQDARDAVAALFEFPSWEEMREAVERRAVLNLCDLAQARAEIERTPRWATADLWGWCDHCLGAAPLSYMAMLRFDAPRLGLTGDFSGTAAMAKLLLEAGAPVDGNPGDSETLLMTAASYGDADVAQVLIDAGAELDRLAAVDSGGVPGGSALLHAAVFGMTDVLNALVNAGAQTPASTTPTAIARAAEHGLGKGVFALILTGRPGRERRRCSRRCPTHSATRMCPTRRWSSRRALYPPAAEPGAGDAPAAHRLRAVS